VTGVCYVIPANRHDLSVTPEHESAATKSGATGVFRPAGLIRAGRLLLDGLRIPFLQEKVVPRTSGVSRPSTDEPSAHPWHQISKSCCTKGRRFQVKAGIQHQQGRWCLRFGSGGRPCPPFPEPRIESGVTV
jgi:hypothetical protein